VRSYKKLERHLHARYMVLQLLMDLGVKGTATPRHEAWLKYMEFLTAACISKAC
jgi:hypothetical protein